MKNKFFFFNTVTNGEYVKTQYIIINTSNNIAADKTSILFLYLLLVSFILSIVSSNYPPNRFPKIEVSPFKQRWLARNRASMHLPTRGNERFLRRVRVTYSADAGADRDQAAGKPMLLSNDPRRHLLRVVAI